MHDPSGRRGLWARITEGPTGDRGAVKVELCAGREGDDAYVSFERDATSDGKMLEKILELVGIISCARFALDSAVDEPYTVEHWAQRACVLTVDLGRLAQEVVALRAENDRLSDALENARSRG